MHAYLLGERVPAPLLRACGFLAGYSAYTSQARWVTSGAMEGAPRERDTGPGACQNPSSAQRLQPHRPRWPGSSPCAHTPGPPATWHAGMHVAPSPHARTPRPADSLRSCCPAAQALRSGTPWRCSDWTTCMWSALRSRTSRCGGGARDCRFSVQNRKEGDAEPGTRPQRADGVGPGAGRVRTAGAGGLMGIGSGGGTLMQRRRPGCCRLAQARVWAQRRVWQGRGSDAAPDAGCTLEVLCYLMSSVPPSPNAQTLRGEHLSRCIGRLAGKVRAVAEPWVGGMRAAGRGSGQGRGSSAAGCMNQRVATQGPLREPMPLEKKTGAGASRGVEGGGDTGSRFSTGKGGGSSEPQRLNGHAVCKSGWRIRRGAAAAAAAAAAAGDGASCERSGPARRGARRALPAGVGAALSLTCSRLCGRAEATSFGGHSSDTGSSTRCCEQTQRGGTRWGHQQPSNHLTFNPG